MRTRLVLMVVVALAGVALAPVSAQEASEDTGRPGAEQGDEGGVHYDRALGIYGGAGLGSFPGLSYQRWLEPWGYQAAAGGYYQKGADSQDWELFADVAVLYRLFAPEIGSWFAGSLYTVVGGLSQRLSEVDRNVVGYRFALRAGIGIESVFFKNFSFPLEFSYGAVVPTYDLDQLQVGLLVHGGFRFRF